MSDEWTPTEWPTLPLPLPEVLARALADPAQREETIRQLLAREEWIRLEQTDPLRHGFELQPSWADARALFHVKHDLLILGGNRSGKTELAAKLVNETTTARAGREVQCWSQNETTSIDRQQTVVHKYLPAELKGIKKSGQVKVSYSRAAGFTERIVVYPGMSVVRFFTFQAYRNDPTVAEGGEADLIWLDELAPADLVRTLRFRLVSRGGRLLQTFTPIEGYSQVVREYLDGARVVRARRAELCPEARIAGCRQGEVPYVLQPRAESRAVILFFTEDNPYPIGNYENMRREVGALSLGERLCRAYGWPTKMVANAFPRWNPEVHVIPASSVPREGTNYLSVDPGGAKNWFMLWLRVDALGRVYAYREWPDIGLGEWAEPGDKLDGKAGPAQKLEAGRGILGYKALILELEDGERIEERLIDPRAGSAEVPGIESGTSLIELLVDEQRDRDEQVIGPSMLFAPAPACRVDEGTELINDALAYDPEKPVTMENCPRLYVSERCANLAYALATWTGADGEKGATKDPVDALKYALKRELQYVDPQMPAWRKGGGY